VVAGRVFFPDVARKALSNGLMFFLKGLKKIIKIDIG
jgi:hypothetical protein